MWERFEKRGWRVIYRRDRLTTLYFTGKFEWPHSSIVSVMVKKMDPSMDFSAATAVLKKSIFQNRYNKSIYEPISKRIVDSEWPRDLLVNAPFRYLYFEIS